MKFKSDDDDDDDDDLFRVPSFAWKISTVMLC